MTSFASIFVELQPMAPSKQCAATTERRGERGKRERERERDQNLYVENRERERTELSLTHNT
jgi:hypothetical protein